MNRDKAWHTKYENALVVFSCADEDDLLGKRLINGESHYVIFPEYPDWYTDEEEDGFTLEQVREHLELDELPPVIVVIEDH